MQPSTVLFTKNPLKKVESSTEEPKIWTTLTLSISKFFVISGVLLMQAWATRLEKKLA